MKKLTLSVLAVTSCFALNAQVTVKKDVLQYYSALPAMPSSTDDAYKKCNCKNMDCRADSLIASLERNLKADQKAMGTLTATQQQQVQNGQAIADRAKAANVNGMTDDQKLQYAKNDPGLNGGNPAAFDFAQKMKDDPAAKAEFKNMTPDQKMAYMQKYGLMNGNANATAMANKQNTPDSNKASDAIAKQKQMQATENGTDGQKYAQALNDAMDMTKIGADHSKIDQDEQAESATTHSGVGGEAGNLLGNMAAKSMHKKYMKKHLELAQTELQNMTKAYQDLYNFLMTTETPYTQALTAASYGYTGDGNQDSNLNTLALGQATVLGNIDNLANKAKNIYEFAANWQAKAN